MVQLHTIPTFYITANGCGFRNFKRKYDVKLVLNHVINIMHCFMAFLKKRLKQEAHGPRRSPEKTVQIN